MLFWLNLLNLNNVDFREYSLIENLKKSSKIFDVENICKNKIISNASRKKKSKKKSGKQMQKQQMLIEKQLWRHIFLTFKDEKMENKLFF